MRDDFLLDSGLAYLNHGAFGAAPRQVLAEQDDVRRRIERNPVEALTGWAIDAVDEARAALARAVQAHPDEIALVGNATQGLQLIARSLVPALPEGKGVLWTDHEYPAQVRLWRAVSPSTASRYRSRRARPAPRCCARRSPGTPSEPRSSASRRRCRCSPGAARVRRDGAGAAR